MNRKRLGFILIGAGVALAFVVGALVYLQVTRAQEIEKQLPTRKVILATEDIPAGSQIQAKQIQLYAVPDQAIPANSAANVDSVVSKFTPATIFKGQVIIATQIGDVATKGVPSYTLKQGQVLYAMETALPNQAPFALTAVNALRSGDRVDLVYSTLVVPPEIAANPDSQSLLRSSSAAQYLQTRILLQNVRIDRLGTYRSDGGFDENAKYMIFIVSPEQALVMKWLKDAAAFFGNSIELVLRAPNDDEISDPNLTINLNYMRDKYGLPSPPQVTTGAR